MKLDKSFIGRKQMRISSAIKEGSGDAITSVSEKRASPSEQWRSGLMSPCRRSRSKFSEVSENLPEDTTSRKNTSSVSTLQFHIEKRRLPKLRSFLWETALRSAQRIIGITVQIESRKTTVPMPNKKPTGQDVSDCDRRKLGLASVVKVEQYPEITLAIQHSVEVLHSAIGEHVVLRFCGHEGQPLCVGMFGLRHTYTRETVDVNKRERLFYGRRSPRPRQLFVAMAVTNLGCRHVGRKRSIPQRLFTVLGA